LLASLSHDLRTPLSAVVGGAVTLAERMEDLKPEERRSLANTVRKAAMHVSEHVTNMLDLVRLESGAIRLRFDSYEIDEIIATVLHRLRERLQSHHVVLDLPEGLPVLTIDGKLIEQVIENIVDNAVKYTPPGSEIRIAAALSDGRMEITIADTGPGFEDVAPETLFGKFERGRKESSVGGIGLGLAICRAIVDLHNGRIWAEEGQPRGAVVHVVLPLTRKEMKSMGDDD
jgi:two-component system, OmpR family, sensor histidine kinase KdpD